MKKSNPEELLAHGLHFGHKAQRVHPRSNTYIYKIENGISIIDLFKTATKLDEAKAFVYDLGKEGKKLMVVSTKKQSRGVVAPICREHKVFFLIDKWIGGFVTNFEEIKKNIKKLETMQKDREEGGWNKFPKHEIFKLEKQLQRIAKTYDGVKELKALPDALFIIDIKHEANAIKEADVFEIPVVGVADTNSDPYTVKYPIPANDDAISSIEYLAKEIIEAYVDGRDHHEEKKAKEAEDKKEEVAKAE